MTLVRPLVRHRLSAATLCGALALSACSTDESVADRNPSSPDTATGSTPVAPDYPVTVASCGRDVVYEQAPSRVVLGYPRTLETLTALGVADAAYGYVLGSYDDLPADYPDEIVEVSPDYAPSRESVIGAGPDLFLGNDEGQVTSESGVSTTISTGWARAASSWAGYPSAHLRRPRSMWCSTMSRPWDESSARWTAPPNWSPNWSSASLRHAT